MSHTYHVGPPGTIWYDGCPECNERAAKLPASLAYLDTLNQIRAWRRMRAWKWGGGHPELALDDEPSANDKKLFDCLYAVGVFLGRGGLGPGEVEAQMIAAARRTNEQAERSGLSARIPPGDL